MVKPPNARKPSESDRCDDAEVVSNREQSLPRPCGYCGAREGFIDYGDGWGACAVCGGI
jgi:hypothetical protein